MCVDMRNIPISFCFLYQKRHGMGVRWVDLMAEPKGRMEGKELGKGKMREKNFKFSFISIIYIFMSWEDYTSEIKSINYLKKWERHWRCVGSWLGKAGNWGKKNDKFYFYVQNIPRSDPNGFGILILARQRRARHRCRKVSRISCRIICSISQDATAGGDVESGVEVFDGWLTEW